MDINIVKLKKYASECSVLYVEDDELIRSQTASFLGRFFPDVVLAEDGKMGLSTYKERKFDVVISDINMPNMNGIEMITAIKEIHYEQKIIVTSAHNDSQYLMSLINLNVAHFVLKPFNNKQFLYVLYKIAEELSFDKEKIKLQEEIVSLSKRAQVIVDQVHVGIVVIKNNEVVMANKAFLEIGGFDSYGTLKLEMPDIGVLFEEASHCITSSTNADLIEELKNVKEEDSKVRIINNSQTIEYQVILTKIEDEESYILTFTDITAIHNAMFKDEHTGLPMRKFILENIEILKQKTSKIGVILMSINHFDNLEKWYGKKSAIDVEVGFANKIKEICTSLSSDTFIGHFYKNQFIVIPTGSNIEKFYDALKRINVSSLRLIEKRQDLDIEFNLLTNIKLEKLDSNKELHQIEVDLINAYDLM
jgi:DNA-binding NarL/FixJ family response regulator/GGDEF domain-containing protein